MSSGLLWKIIQNEDAFTLLEVMISMAVLSITLVTIFQVQSQSISMEAQSRFLTTAALLAQSKMAEMEKQNYNDDINRCGRFPDDFQNYTWELDVFDMEERRLQKIILTFRNEDMKTHNIYRVILCKPRG